MITSVQSQKKILPLHDNAKQHVLPHPSYSPNIVPPDLGHSNIHTLTSISKSLNI